jgi:kynurenine formamidase
VPDLTDVLAAHDLLDLSVPYGEEYPVSFPGHPPFQHKVHNWYAPVAGPQHIRSTAAYFDNWMLIDEHSGTHFDAPPHFIPPPASGLPHASELGAVTGEHVPLEQLQGPAAVIDCRPLRNDEPGISPRITVEYIEAWEAEHGALQPGDVVLCLCGWDRYFRPLPLGDAYSRHPLEGHAPGWPAPTAEAVLYCHERGVRVMGTDASTIGAADDLESMHYAGLGNNLLFIESLARLERLPPRGAYFVFLPIKVLRSSGAPGRAIAYIPRSDP